MWIFNTILLLFMLIIFMIENKSRDDWIINMDKKEHKLYFLYPMSHWIIKRTSINKILNKSTKVNDSLRSLYLTGKQELLNKLYWCNRVSQIIIVVFLFNLLSLFAFLINLSNETLINGNFLLRPDYGQGSTQVKIKVSFEEGDDSELEALSKLPESKEVTIDVKERRYNSQEIKKLFAKAVEYLNKEVIGNNESAKLIYKDLNFITSIPGTSIKVQWFPKDYGLIQSNGVITNEKIKEEGVTTTVIAVLKYHDVEMEQVFTFHLCPKQISADELLNKNLEEKLNAYSENSKEDELMELPSSVERYDLSWEDMNKDKGLTLLFLGVILAVLIWFLGDKELEKQMKLRKEQMQLDYPEIINKFTLLVNAGMTIKQAWYKVAEDYNGVKAQKDSLKRYAYEEMLATTYEIKFGVPENSAYEQFGRRIGLISYIKFSSLISQNLKKGNKGFTELLIHEATQAFENRKEMAKRQGEEASTKLLMPMMMLLIIVFLIIMIPAFMAFQL